MKVVIAFKSRKNTKKIAMAMGDVLHTTPMEIDGIKKVEAADILFLGFGIYGGNATLGVSSCEAPTFDVASGTYNSTQTVALSCVTAGATVRYTTNGDEPTSESAVYSTPISVASTTKIKAKAFKDGMNSSTTASATYTITPPVIDTVETPTFSVASGTYSGTQTVALSCATAGATIRYTTNGDEPTSESAAYSTPISVASTTTIKAKAFKDGMNSSTTASATYTISVPGPTPPPAPVSEPVPSPVPAPIEYKITNEQKENTWTPDSDKGLEITVNADLTKLTGVSIDEEPVPKAMYDAKLEDNSITVLPSYLNTLSEGEHLLQINFLDGYVETNFAVSEAPENPKTCDNSMSLLWLGAILIAGASLATVTGFYRCKNKN